MYQKYFLVHVFVYLFVAYLPAAHHSLECRLHESRNIAYIHGCCPLLCTVIGT